MNRPRSPGGGGAGEVGAAEGGGVAVREGEGAHGTRRTDRRPQPTIIHNHEFKEKAKSNLGGKSKATIDGNENMSTCSSSLLHDKNFLNSKKSFDSTLETESFQTANGKNVVISEEGKKRVEALLNEFHESDGDNEDNLLCVKYKVISKKQSMLSEKKVFKTSLISRKEEADYP
ncbi:hypothetical protein GQX74_010570 [Glossina fuscipes]|nr:hypothetical protein GQX74_010570 [Glossina fuscipes]